jgi:peroxiredoxin
MQVRVRPVRPGESAPSISLPAINREGTVALDDFRGRSGVLIGFFRGLHCPFCRRQLVQLATAQPALQEAGVETLAVVNTPVERARLYFRHRPTPVTLLADPECRSHQAFGVPRIQFVGPGEEASAQWPTRATLAEFEAARINPTGELDEPVSPLEANTLLNKKQAFELTPDDEQIFAAHGTQLAGHFLLDRDGIVRWTHVEAADAAADLCVFPTPAELIDLARQEGGRRP